MGDCKRYLVKAIGMDKTDKLAYATNQNPGECTGEVGKCGCIHAEMVLLTRMPRPSVVVVSVSPCLDCAKVLVEAGVSLVIYQEAYRDAMGIAHLLDNGVQVHSPGYTATKWKELWDNAAAKTKEKLVHKD